MPTHLPVLVRQSLLHDRQQQRQHVLVAQVVRQHVERCCRALPQVPHTQLVVVIISIVVVILCAPARCSVACTRMLAVDGFDVLQSSTQGTIRHLGDTQWIQLVICKRASKQDASKKQESVKYCQTPSCTLSAPSHQVCSRPTAFPCRDPNRHTLAWSGLAPCSSASSAAATSSSYSSNICSSNNAWSV